TPTEDWNVPGCVIVTVEITIWLMLGVTVNAISGTLVSPCRAEAGASDLPDTRTSSGLIDILRESCGVLAEDIVSTPLGTKEPPNQPGSWIVRPSELLE